ncbi:hypothetical protein D3C73_1473250 [compost metagenome]
MIVHEDIQNIKRWIAIIRPDLEEGGNENVENSDDLRWIYFDSNVSNTRHS